MILLRRAYRGHDIEIRPAVLAGTRVRQAQIWVDGRALATLFPCPRAAVLLNLLKVAQQHIDRLPEHQPVHPA